MKQLKEVPYINVRDVVLFPKMSLSLYVGRKPTIEAIKFALQHSKPVLVIAQKLSETNNVSRFNEMYAMGTLCSVEGSIHLQDGTMKVQLNGLNRFKASRIYKTDGVPMAFGKQIQETKSKGIPVAQKQSLLELLVSAKPMAALDADATWFEDLISTKNDSIFIETIQRNLNCRGFTHNLPTPKWNKNRPSRGETVFANAKIKIQQRILEEKNTSKKINLLQKYFKLEIRNTAEKILKHE